MQQICVKLTNILFCATRVFESQLTNVMIRMEDAGRPKWLFDTFMAHAKGGTCDFGWEIRGPNGSLKYSLGEFMPMDR